jgi:tRNA (adenine57-N1/adenine58-N1)-methyltransferase
MNFARDPSETIPRVVREGDVVICYQGHNSLDYSVMKKGDVIQNRFGAFKHDDIIGKPFGQKHYTYSEDSKHHIIVLEPTPELWSNSLKTRTQIVDEMDASFVTFMLDVKPGETVIESGTGSGCMSIALARAVNHRSKPGHVYTFEYNPVRAQAASEEFKLMGLEKCVTVQCVDVCAKYDKVDGGGFPGVTQGSVDSVFLDLPEPWHALPYALELMKPNRPICCYSPCIEQVIETCAKLRELGFHTIRMMESKQRLSDTKVVELEQVDLGLGADDEDDGGAGREKGDKKDTSTHGEAMPATKKRKVDAASTSSGNDASGSSDREAEATGEKEKADADGAVAGVGAGDERPTRYWVKKDMPKRSMKVNRPNHVMKGHTAFLTFAYSPVADSE